jgi:hypothetical protein
MKRSAQDLGAEFIPIGSGIDQVEMPSLIDLIRRRHRVTRAHRQKQKSPVFLNHSLGVITAPTILPHQSLREGQMCTGHIELEGFKL